MTTKTLRDAAITVVDTETTGFDPEQDKLVEIGWSHIDYSERFLPGNQAYQLFNPGIAIPAVASAVHHITDRDVVNQPASASFPGIFDRSDLLVAHNAAFDAPFLRSEKIVGADTPFLCTYRLAMHLLTDAPAYKNQVLRYWLGFYDVPGDAHRAGHDAYVTAMILCYMLNTEDLADWTIAGIIELAESPIFLLNRKMGFGKHSNLTWGQCPRSYLQWMAKQGEQSPTNPDGWDRDQWYTVNQILNGRTEP